MTQTIPINVTGRVEISALANLRQGLPNRAAPVIRKLPAGTQLQVLALVVGESVQGNAHWYQVEPAAYVWSGACGPLKAGPPAPPEPTSATVNPAFAGFGLDPVFASKLTTLFQACAEKGLVFRISQGLRTPDVQAQYYCRWDQRSPAQIDQAVTRLREADAPWLADILASHRDIKRQKAWLTNALPGAGWHQWGEAADCYCYRNGQMVESGADPCYETYATLAEKLGLTAGLRFSRPDAGHVQLRAHGGATDLFAWSHIDAVMRERFGAKPGLAD
ncbi:D-alanyl-D-alanine carboxypeptidase family protein [Caulobacter sp. NIBR1757]|uniref:D-alanyl-D-alanine carboxypeptidase family protein n=1 Tax=Caulobacter sp. NIBR1757 TaxID=3016000 RepID=UPI0022F00565|nr:D-alanyl-D-alanine carboxypeptidase family protein [Caulobacter sp. NIBR1757]WGM39138.1 hypothetical protein AMEJIAPC_02052 [Caulobacter sp. NIBR1757]